MILPPLIIAIFDAIELRFHYAIIDHYHALRRPAHLIYAIRLLPSIIDLSILSSTTIREGY